MRYKEAKSASAELLRIALVTCPRQPYQPEVAGVRHPGERRT